MLNTVLHGSYLSINFLSDTLLALQKHYSFPELAKILSLFCLSDDPEDNISLDAAVCLGKLCVADPNAKAKLCQIVQESKDTHVKAEVS